LNPALTVLRFGAVLLLGAAAFAVLRPFLQPMLWAGILAYCTWPLYRKVAERAKRPRVAAGVFTLGVALGVGVPLAFLLAGTADDARALVAFVREWRDTGGVPAWVMSLPYADRALQLLQQTGIADPARASDLLAQWGSSISRQLVSIAGGVARNVFSFGVMLLTLFVFYVNGAELVSASRQLANLLFPRAPELFIDRIGESVRAVVFGLLGTAIAQGLLSALGMAIAGVPSPLALGAATTVLSFVPGGAAAVSVLAAIWLGIHDRIGAALGLAAWGILVVGSTDNVLRPLLISGRGKLPFLLIFFGVLGGLASFGLIGLFVGPVILSVVFALVREYAQVSASDEAVAAGSRPR
jgi:predicted PurR-regulated permease PerM